jgi:hypothetical protein
MRTVYPRAWTRLLQADNEHWALVPRCVTSPAGQCVRPLRVDELQLRKRPRRLGSGGPVRAIGAQAPENVAHHPPLQAAQSLGMRVAGGAAFLVVDLASPRVSDLGKRDPKQRDIKLSITGPDRAARSRTRVPPEDRGSGATPA